MNLTEYGLLCTSNDLPTYIDSYELKNLSDRTLIWGYTLLRHSFHVYLYKQLFHLYVYSFHKETIEVIAGAPRIDVDRCLPSKRAYPEACDFEFCQLIKNHGGDICFTTFQENRGPAQFYGDLIPD